MTDTNEAQPDASGPTPDTAARASAAPGYFQAGPVVMLVIAGVAVLTDQITKILADRSSRAVRSSSSARRSV